MRRKAPGNPHESPVVYLGSERSSAGEKESSDYFQMERSYGSFSKIVYLPSEVNSEGVSATFKDGVLEIQIPNTGSLT
jgi:HSP20 family protein